MKCVRMMDRRLDDDKFDKKNRQINETKKLTTQNIWQCLYLAGVFIAIGLIKVWTFLDNTLCPFQTLGVVWNGGDG